MGSPLGQTQDPIVTAFERQLGRDPHAKLVTAPSQSATLDTVEALARVAAAALWERRIPAGCPVGLAAPNGTGFLAGFLACLRMGCPAVLLDSNIASAELERVASSFRLAAVLRVPSAWPRDALDFEVQHHEGGPSGIGLDATVIMLTSGSTGEPRGVAGSSEALLADGEALWAAMGFGERDRLLAMVPFSHRYGLTTLVLPALVRGIPLVLPGSSTPFEPLKVAEWAEATVLPTVPAWITALVRLADPPTLAPSLRRIITAGAPLMPQTALEFRERFGRPIQVLYGASECGGIAFDMEGGAGERGTVGEAVPGVKIALETLEGLDPAAGRRVVVSSRAVARTYWPAPDPRLGDGRFATQDLGVMRNNELRLLGRLDHLINARGLKVNPAEVEAVIAQLASVEEVVVHGVEAGRPGDPIVQAVVACSSRALTADVVMDWCRGRLTDHKVPRRVLLVRDLPRTPRGKVDRSALLRLGSGGAGRAASES